MENQESILAAAKRELEAGATIALKFEGVGWFVATTWEIYAPLQIVTCQMAHQPGRLIAPLAALQAAKALDDAVGMEAFNAVL